MKRHFALLLFILSGVLLFGQQKELAEKLVGEGVELHDAGDYNGAMAKYDEALLLDKNNLYALAEKAMTFLVIQRADEAIKVCEVAIKEHKGSELLYMVYVIYGNAYDELGKGRQSIDIYDKGIEQFPDFYQLYFNKGVTLLGLDRLDEAISFFQKSASLNPNHAGSHSAMGRTLYSSNKLIPSLLAFANFFVLEPKSNRAYENIDYIRDILARSANQTDNNTVMITVNAETIKEGSVEENDFSSVELLLGLSTALDFEEKYAEETEVERFIRKFKMVCISLSTQEEGKSGFYWEYYVPFFVEMNRRDLIETFGHIVFVSSGNDNVLSWIRSNEEQIGRFYEWVKSYNDL